MSTSGTTAVNTTGETNVSHDVKKRTGSDCIPDKQMEEIARRLISFVESDEGGDVIFAPVPPNDKRKLWVETDAAGAIIGTVKRFDSKSGQWVDDHTVAAETPDQVFPRTFIFAGSVDENDATEVEIEHDLDTEDYFYDFVPLSEPDNDARWHEVSKTANLLTISLRKYQDIDFEVRILENLSAPEEE